MAILTLMAILLGEVVWCFLKRNFLYYYCRRHKNNKDKS